MRPVTFTKKGLYGGLLLYLALCGGLQAQANGLTLSPVVIELDSPRQVVAVTVTNDADHAATFQTETVLWRQVNGVDFHEPTDALLVVPPIVQVPPHTSQVFRVTLRVPTPSAVERSYRLILEDISMQLSAVGATSVAFKFAHNLPVMVAPSGKPISAVRWQPCGSALTLIAPAAGTAPKQSDRAAGFCVRLLNAGNRRMKVQGLTLTGDGWEYKHPLKEAVNVLAGVEHEWHVPLPASQTGAVQGVWVDTARSGVLQAEIGGF